jgi:prevent-host-death family protein
LGELFRLVARDGESVLVERAGEPQAVIVSLAEYERLKRGDGDDPRRLAFRRVLEVGDEVRRSSLGMALPDAADVINEARTERTAGLDEAGGS